MWTPKSLASHAPRLPCNPIITKITEPKNIYDQETCLPKSVILVIMGLHGSLGAWLASDFGVHITADQLLVRGEDLNQIFQWIQKLKDSIIFI